LPLTFAFDFCLLLLPLIAKAKVAKAKVAKAKVAKAKVAKAKVTKNKNEMNFCPFALVLRAYAAAATKQKQGHACAAQKRGKQMAPRGKD
jgi:hypothetical protein